MGKHSRISGRDERACQLANTTARNMTQVRPGRFGASFARLARSVVLFILQTYQLDRLLCSRQRGGHPERVGVEQTKACAAGRQLGAAFVAQRNRFSMFGRRREVTFVCSLACQPVSRAASSLARAYKLLFAPGSLWLSRFESRTRPQSKLDRWQLLPAD